MARVRIAEFGLTQKLLAGAIVTFYTADSNGESTGTKATLYAASTGSTARSNPQTLDADGKLENDCYVESTVMAAISNISDTADRSIKKIKAVPTEYALPVTSANYLGQSLTPEDVADNLDLSWQGAWATATDYVADNLAKNSGTTYICTADHTSGSTTEPGTGASWTSYWSTFAEKGSAGAGSGDLLASNNLSDLSSASTARANLGLAIGSNVQAYDAELAAIAALTSAANKIIMFSGSGQATLIDFKDEDNMASNSATAVVSQQSLVAYVGSIVPGVVAQEADAAPASGTVTLNMNSGCYRKVSPTGNFTIDITPISGKPWSYVLELVNGGSYTITWTGVDEWASGSTPSLSTSGTDLIGFIADDDGTVRGYLIGSSFS